MYSSPGSSRSVFGKSLPINSHFGKVPACQRLRDGIWNLGLAIALATLVSPLIAQQPVAPNGGMDQDADSLEILPVPVVEQRVIPIIDSSLAGWNEAGSGLGQTGDALRANWVMLDSSGGISGTVLGQTDFDVAQMRIFALRDGFTVSQTTADANGNFQIDGLTPGLLTIVGYNPSAFFAYGCNAVEFRNFVRYMPRRVTTRAVASFGNKIQVSELIEKHAPQVRFPAYGKYSFGEEDLSTARHFGWQGLEGFDVAATPATTIQSRTVALDASGRFSGRARQIHNRNGRPVPIRQTTMKLIHSGRVVNEAICDRYGVFQFTGVPAGDYGLVAVGSDGFAAIGIRLFSPREPISSRNRQTGPSSRHTVQRASLTRPVTPPLDLTLAQTDAIGWINHYVTGEQFDENSQRPRPVPAPRCPTCFTVYFGPAPGCSCHR